MRADKVKGGILWNEEGRKTDFSRAGVRNLTKIAKFYTYTYNGLPSELARFHWPVFYVRSSW